MTEGRPNRPAWIGSSHPFDLSEAYLDLRRAFQLEYAPRLAHISISADSRYKLWINGEFVARGPARSFPQQQSIDLHHRIESRLMPGPNAIAVQVYQPGYSHFAYVHRGAAGLYAQLTCDNAHTMITDTSWRVRRNPSFASLVPRVSIYGSGVEERNLNLDDDWTSPQYDDANWTDARIVAPEFGYPWIAQQSRELPLLEERDLPMTLLETRVGAYPAAYDRDAHLALRQGWSAAHPQPVHPDGDWFAPKLAGGEAAYWLFDLGRDYVCQGWTEVQGASGAERLSISYAEKIRDGELVISDPETYCRVRLTDHFQLRAGDQIAETFSLRGGRYLLFQLVGATAANSRIRFHTRVSEYPLRANKEVRTSDRALTQIIMMCENTLRACLQDCFIDSTWRESSQWTGDALPHALIMAAMSDDTRPLRRVIEMAAQGAYPDGILPSVLPGEVHAYTIVDYNFVWVELLSLYWKLCEDEETVSAFWPTLVKMLDRFHQDVSNDGLLISQPGRRLFLDWSPISRSEPNAVYNLHYLLALELAAQLARDMKKEEDAVRWQQRAEALQLAVRAAFWQDGCWYDDLARSTFSQLAAALALLSDTAQPDEAEARLDAIAARSLDPDDSHEPHRMVLASPFMHHYVFEALRRGGRNQQVMEIIKLRWGRWAQAGHPTTWENWNVDFPDGSQCHAFSAHPRFHLAEIARAQGSL